MNGLEWSHLRRKISTVLYIISRTCESACAEDGERKGYRDILACSLVFFGQWEEVLGP